jgi:hypothetical protein
MGLSLDIKLRDAYEKFGENKLISLISSGFNQLTGLPQTQPYVTIDPPENMESTRRTITWNLNANIVNTDDASGWTAVRNTIQNVISGAARVLHSSLGTVPSPAEVTDATFDTIENIEDIWEKSVVPKLFSLIRLPVKYKNRNGRPLVMKSKLAVDALWITNDADDYGNRAWIELELHKIDLFPDHKANPAQWNANDSYDSPGQGRAIMKLNDTDLIGTFSPTTSPLHECSVEPVERDESTVSFDVSFTAEADDTVIILIRAFILELEIGYLEESPGEPGRNRN